MARLVGLFLCLLYFPFSNAQEVKVFGTIKDAITTEALIGASVIYAEGKGTVADIDGKYELNLAPGTYTLKASFVGYLTQEKAITLTEGQNELNINFLLDFETLNEVEIVADFATARKTPVAFTNVAPKLIAEELGSQDLPMVLNTTPGVYATQQGGGDGDARVTIRGFSQRNIAVMIDGVPVNDMENGWVYWSNWFGLDAVQRNMQVQRGLGASKIAIPSVGGTINILTTGIDQKRKIKIKQEVGNNGFLRTSLGYNSGKLKGDWGFTAAGSYKQGDGWVQGLFTEGSFYYLKVEKKLGKHMLSASAMGAPQKHGQRAFKESMRVYDSEFSNEVNSSNYLLIENPSTMEYDTTLIPTYGLNYNQHVGNLERYTLDGNGNKTNVSQELLNERQNYYHKPQFTLKDFFIINEKTALSNIVYLSVGNGGGVRLDDQTNFLDNGTVDFQTIYDANTGYSFEPTPFFPDDPTIVPQIHPTEHAATNFLKSSINNHFWYGLLSTISTQKTDHLELSGGLDLRRYKGEHYREVYDLLGADYAIFVDNPNMNTSVRKVGDIIDYHNDSWVQWAGLFAQAEYSKNRWSAFINIAGAQTGYKRRDYFLPRQLVLGDTTLTPGYQFVNAVAVPDSIIYQGNVYTPESDAVEFQETEWIQKAGFTIKAGANLNITEDLNAFMNLGYFSRAPRFNNVFDFGNQPFIEIKNEKIKSIEFGARFAKEKFASNLNGYYTYWENRPAPRGFSVPDPNDPENNLSANVNGMNARHMGAELDFIYKFSKKLEWEGVLSYGDWIWDSKDTVFFSDDNGNPIIDLNTGERVKTSFDAKGVHVGDAAQSQVSTSLKFIPIKGAYVKARYTFFDRFFSDFNPIDLDGENAGRESWRIPSYGVLEIHSGYGFKFNDIKCNLRFSILNALDSIYITDALNNETRATYIESQNFDATSAGVFFAQGRRFNTSLTLTF